MKPFYKNFILHIFENIPERITPVTFPHYLNLRKNTTRNKWNINKRPICLQYTIR